MDRYRVAMFRLHSYSIAHILFWGAIAVEVLIGTGVLGSAYIRDYVPGNSSQARGARAAMQKCVDHVQAGYWINEIRSAAYQI